MKHIDRILQNWRIQKCMRYIGKNASVIDIGAHQGELFEALGENLSKGFGVEPLLRTPLQTPRFVIQPGFFPKIRPIDPQWDAITLLAVLEHIPPSDQSAISAACYDLLKEKGRVIVTVPSQTVDYILSVLKFLRLIDGMSLEEHFGFKPQNTVKIFSSPQFNLICHKRFQFGLNHLYVFEKT